MLHIPNALAPSHSYPQSVRTRFGYGFVAFCKSLWHTASDWSCTWLWAPTWRIAHLARCHPDFNVHVQSHQTAPSALHASRSFFFALIIWIWICASISNLQCHSRPPKMTVPIDIVWATPLPKPPVSCHLPYNHAAKAAKLDGVMPHALRVTRNFLLTRKACGLRTGNLAALRRHCGWCGRKSVTV